MLIETVYGELRDIGVVRSSDEFSKSWLGKERSYMRCLRAKHREPSLKALATCAVRLLKTADGLSKSETPVVLAKGTQLRRLANRCLEEILTEGLRQ